MNVLVVAAHPDDEVLGCGGRMARLAGEGHSIYIAILGEGMTSRYGRREEADPKSLEMLRACSRKAAKALGAREVFLHDLPDNRFDTVPLLEVVKLVEGIVERVKPQAVYTHHGGDLNIDHAITFRATLTATRPVPGQSVRELYAFEVPSSTEWAFASGSFVFRPNVFADISQTLENKIQAMRLYESEVRSFPHPRSPEALEAVARRWGSTAGVFAAEAFELIRLVQ